MWRVVNFVNPAARDHGEAKSCHVRDEIPGNSSRSLTAAEGGAWGVLLQRQRRHGAPDVPFDKHQTAGLAISSVLPTTSVRPPCRGFSWPHELDGKLPYSVPRTVQKNLPKR